MHQHREAGWEKGGVSCQHIWISPGGVLALYVSIHGFNTADHGFKNVQQLVVVGY